MAVETLTGVGVLVGALRQARLDEIVGVAGRPLTPVLEALVASGDARWANHEAIALQLALGVAGSGGRSVLLVKQVGMNAGLDVLACAAPHRIGGSLVLVVGDDPGGLYSQIEGDSRLLARATEVPCLEPAGAEDLPCALADALALSARVRTPVVLRVTTQLMNAHARPAVALEPAGRGEPFDSERTWRTDPLGHRRALLAELRALPEDAASATVRAGEGGSLRVVAAGAPAPAVVAAVRETLVVRRVHPAPVRALADFALRTDGPLLVLEEGQPLLEDELRALAGPAEVLGRRSGHVPWAGPVDAAAAVAGVKRGELAEEPEPALMAGDDAADLTGYGSLFEDVAALGFGPVAVDAGNSWAAAYLPGGVAPFSYGLGSAIGVAGGLALATGRATVAAIGDFGLYHAGILGLLQVVHDRLPVMTVVADNDVAAYTGGQPHLGSSSIEGRDSIPLEQLVRGAGVQVVERIPKEDATSDVLRPLLARLASLGVPSVLLIEDRS